MIHQGATIGWIVVIGCTILVEVNSNIPMYDSSMQYRGARRIYHRQGQRQTYMCQGEGFYADPNDCSRFYRCVPFGAGYTAFEFQCSDGTVYDETIIACNNPWSVSGPCGARQVSGNVMSYEYPFGPAHAVPPASTSSPGQSPLRHTHEPSKNRIPQRPSDDANEIDYQYVATRRQETRICNSEGLFPDPNDCSKFYRCSNSGNGRFNVHYFDCPRGAVYDFKLKICSQARNRDSATLCRIGNIPNNQHQNTEEKQVINTNSFRRNNPNEKTSTVQNANKNTKQKVPLQQSNSVRTTENQQQSSNGATTSSEEPPCDKPEYKGECTSEGFFPVQGDCKKFYRCVSNGKPGSYSKYDFECGDGTVFDPDINVCNHASAVQRDCNNPQTGTSTSTPMGSHTESSSQPMSSTEAANNEMQENNVGPSGTTMGQETSVSTTTTTEPEQSEQPAATQAPPTSTTTQRTQMTTTEKSSTSNGASTDSMSNATTQPDDSSNMGNSSQGQCNGECTSAGFFPTPGDCKLFYRCVDNGNGGYDRYDFVCAEGTVFDPQISVCNHERDVHRDCNAPAECMATSTEMTQGSSSGAMQETTPSQAQEGTSSSPPEDQVTEMSMTTATSDESSTDIVMEPTTAQPAAETTSNNLVMTTSSGDMSETQPMPEESPSTESNGPGTTKPSTSGECTSEGFFPTPGNCKKFYRCVDHGNGALTKYEFDCAEGTVFDPSINVCNHERDVHRDCGTPAETTTGNYEDGTTMMGTTLQPDDEHSTAEGTTESITTMSQSQTNGTTVSPVDEGTSPSSPPQVPPCTPIDPNPPVVDCTKDGYYADPSDCANFYRCIDLDGDKGERFRVYFFRCPDGNIYDPEKNACDKPENINPPRVCDNMTTTPAVETTTVMETTTLDSETTTGYETTMATDTTTSPPETTTVMETTTAAETETTTAIETTTVTTEFPEEMETTFNPDSQVTTTGYPDTTTMPDTTEMVTESETTTMPVETTTMAETTTASSTPPTTPTQAPPPGECDCCDTEEGQYAYICPTGFRRHPRYCNRFYQCTLESENDLNVIVFSCPDNRTFVADKQQCLTEDEGGSCSAEYAQDIPPSSRSRNSKPPIKVSRDALCPNKGFYAYEADCQHFIHCKEDKRRNLRGSIKRCPDGFTFWEISRRCELSSRIAKKCSGRSRDVTAWNIPIDYANVGRLSRQLLRLL